MQRYKAISYCIHLAEHLNSIEPWAFCEVSNSHVWQGVGIVYSTSQMTDAQAHVDRSRLCHGGKAINKNSSN